MTLTPDDLKVIIASARRIIELAVDLPKDKRRDFVAEAAAIITLLEPHARPA
jgi:hypothetical protein